MEKENNFNNIESFLKEGIVRSSILEIFQEVLHTGRTQGFRGISGLIARKLREMKKLHSQARRLVSDTLYDLIRKLRRLSVLTHAKNPSAEKLYLAWVFDQFLNPSLFQDNKNLYIENDFFQKEFSRVHLSIPTMVEQITCWEELSCKVDSAFIKDQAAILGEIFSYPSWMVEKIIESYGLLKTKEMLQGQNQRAPLTVRVNHYKGSRSELAQKLAQEKIPSKETLFSSLGLILQTSQNVYALDLFQQGLFEIQDEGSQLIAELVAPPPGGTVIDACAGAGGKTLALGSFMGNKGRILAMDVEQEKLEELQKRVRRSGLTNVQTFYLKPGSTFPHQQAQRVLCDVPCSGLGVLRRHPEARWAVQKQDIEELKEKQKAILEQYADLVMEGGRLIYSTCTILPEENEEMVQSFLKEHSEFVLMPIKEIWGTKRAAQLGDGMYLRILPIEPEGPDGFFAAVLRKVGSGHGRAS